MTSRQSVRRPAPQGSSLVREKSSLRPPEIPLHLTTVIHPQVPPGAQLLFGFFPFFLLFNNERVTQRFNELPGEVNQKGSPLSKRIIKTVNGQWDTIIAGNGSTGE